MRSRRSKKPDSRERKASKVRNQGLDEKCKAVRETEQFRRLDS